jgi:hypothetical protein
MRTTTVQYEEKEDRKILKAREAHVVEVRSVPDFYLRLSNGTTFEFNGTVIHSIGPRGEDAVRRSLTALPAEDLSTLISARPLSWVVFHEGSQRIVFSNTWFLTLTPGPDDTWRLDLGDGRVLTHPPQQKRSAVPTSCRCGRPGQARTRRSGSPAAGLSGSCCRVQRRHDQDSRPRRSFHSEHYADSRAT